MKILILLLLFLICFRINAQKFKFESFDNRTLQETWKTKLEGGVIEITKDTIFIATDFKVDVFEIMTRQRFIREDDEIFICYGKTRFRLTCTDLLRKYFELHFYQDRTFIRYCLTIEE